MRNWKYLNRDFVCINYSLCLPSSPVFQSHPFHQQTKYHEPSFLEACVVVVVCCCCCIRLFATPWTAVCQASLSFTISWSFLKLMCIGSVMPSNHLILCCPLLLLPSIFPRSFPISCLFASGGQSTGASTLASVFPMNIQD